MILRLLVVRFALLFVAFIWASYWVSKPQVEGERGTFAPVIAEFSEALTFARTTEALILVADHSGDGDVGALGAERTAG